MGLLPLIGLRSLRCEQLIEAFSFPELRSFWSAGGIESSGWFQFGVRKSWTSDSTAQSQEKKLKNNLKNSAAKYATVAQLEFRYTDLQCKEKFEKLISLLVKCVVLENKDVSQFNGFGKSFNKSY